MKVIPKLQSGGFMSLFTTYTPVLSLIPIYNNTRDSYSGRRRKSDDDDEKSSKDTMSAKDMLELVSKIDGLPSDMLPLFDNLLRIFLVLRINGAADVSNLTSLYLSSIYLMKVATYNKKEYDNAYKEVTKNEGLHEYAITSSGNIAVLDKENLSLNYVSASELLNNGDKYTPLTNSNLLYLRANSPYYSNDNKILGTVSNGIGMKLVTNMIKNIISNLGSSTETVSEYSNRPSSYVMQGMDVLSQTLELANLSGLTLDGIYKNKLITKEQKEQANAALQYIYSTLPENAKTLLSLKAGNASNPTQGAIDLISNLITSNMTSTDYSADDYKGDIEGSRRSKSSGGSNSGEDPKFGYWAQVLSGQGGTDTTCNILTKNGGSSETPAKFYGNTPGPDSNCSLQEYLNQSGASFVRSNKFNITFGNITLDSNSFNDVVVNRSAGAYVATIPVKDGKPWLEMAEIYSNFKKDLRKSGVRQNSEQYKNKVTELLNNPEYSALSLFVLSDGELNPNNSGHFLILEGLTSDKASGILDNEKLSLDEFDSKYIINVSDDSEIYDELKTALSSEKSGTYDIDEPGIIFRGNEAYKGNIFIPLSDNLVDASNADGTDIKESTSHRYDEAAQDWQKTNNFAGSSSDILQPRFGIL